MFTKTGTTIVGVKYKGGVVICADTRSTSGPIVADKNCSKIHYISDNIQACGAGTSADITRVTRKASKVLSIFSKTYNRLPRVSHCVRTCQLHLHPYQGHISAALVVGGVDDTGAHLYDVYPHGSSNSVSYTALGSGSLAAISILEAGYKDMNREEAMELACAAIEAGIMNDLYSGSNIDVCVISQEGREMFRNYKKVGVRNEVPKFQYPRSSVKILKEDIYKYIEEK
ncbi:proteasome subunit PSB2 (PSB2) [Vairimorpha necatrix]|uniref:Proteasome subunit beta n=1 Tax=Vairimorpha necatrix TaxID=6039 RepID=A0AAX4JAE2_9MICR|nr:Chain H, Proteasome subunit beta type-2 [Vairimorpha necatrix]8ADN_V Chain V, Proteasome subunit beta type-2 [Vairimorpha necatrix]